MKEYEVAPGLYIGSEIGDIGRVIKTLMKKWVEEGDKDAFRKIKYFQDKRMELLMAKVYERDNMKEYERDRKDA
jgi:hypothetical protein